MTSNRIKDIPDYECDVCNKPLLKEHIRHSTIHGSRQFTFCSIGCYYEWAQGEEHPYPEDYDS